MSVAKGIGGGFPLGACLATAEAAKGMTVGTHGTTFGGNPLAMAVGNAVLDVVLAPGFLDHVERMALLLKQRLAELKDRHPAVIAEIRGEGLLLGLRTPRRRTRDFVAAARGAEPAHGPGRRQRRAPPAAADHRRGRDRRGVRPARRSRDGARGGDAGDGPAGSRRMTTAPAHFLDLAPSPAPSCATSSRRAPP